MTVELTMPALSPTMEKGTVAKWLVSPGQRVKAGDLLAEIETDKATVELEAEHGGLLTEIRVPAGSEGVPVGSVLAILVEEGGISMESPVFEPKVLEQKPPALSSEPPPVPIIQTPTAPPSSPRTRPADRIRVSPLAARIADAKGIDLDAIAGTGPNGRIVRADLGLAPLAALPASPLARPTTSIAPPPEGVPVTREKLSSMRKTIARRLSESKQQIPHFYLTAHCNLDALLSVRRQLNASLDDRKIKLSVNDMLIKAMALALERVPDANVQFGGDELLRFERTDVSMAVAIEDGLVTPVLRDVGVLSLSAIAVQTKALAAKARAGKLMPRDYTGGTVSISNLGMFGIDEMIPVINPPQALILGTAAGTSRPWNVEGKIALATIMAATASFDHRAIDGAVGAQFIAAFRDAVESPLSLCS